jgi:hypothetical protein
MNAFLVDLENKPGELARVAEVIAAKGVNITAVSGSTCGSSGRVALMASDDAATRIALGEARCTFSELPVTVATLMHEPGALASACRRLADAGVNIEALMPIGMQGSDVQVAFVTNEPATAKQILAHAMA